MKYIFDFDDVLFFTSKKFIEYEYSVLAKAGISPLDIQKYYQEIKTNNKTFSFKDMFEYLSIPQKFYLEIMSSCKNFVNEDLIYLVKKIGKENCFIVTYGDEDFQKEKIKYSDIEDVFSEITVVQGSKKEAIEKICLKYKDEEVLFIDDKQEHFDNLDMKKYPNLKTILYTGQDLKYALLP